MSMLEEGDHPSLSFQDSPLFQGRVLAGFNSVLDLSWILYCVTFNWKIRMHDVLVIQA